MQKAEQKVEYPFLNDLKSPDLVNWQPLIFKSLEDPGLRQIIKDERPVYHDNLRGQIRELIKIRTPREKLTDNDLDLRFDEWAAQHEQMSYGVYVYYPWNNNLVHLVDEEEFIELRTSRNKLKITSEEQMLLKHKAIGIIGLSVGQSVAMTIATERTAGTLRIADFDTLELTNLNRIRSGVGSLGLLKTVMVAREIAEIDPFLRVEIFNDGITSQNIEEFMGTEKRLDLLIEECDSLPIKILSRLKARELGIPVIMDTSDRGLIDVERFDLDPQRSLLHGKVSISDMKQLENMSPNEKSALLMAMVDFENLSERMKLSFSEVGKSLTTWPQLASDVVSGGGITAKLARKILLGESIPSNRYYFDEADQLSKPSE